MTLETPRLFLRPWCETDAQELFLLAKNPKVSTTSGWKPPKSVQESRQIICGELSRDHNYAIIHKNTNLMIGGIALQHISGSPERIELGYWLGEAYWGRNFMPEAVKVILRHAFVYLGYKEVCCICSAENRRSRRVLEKCGFCYQHAASHSLNFYQITKRYWLALQSCD